MVLESSEPWKDEAESVVGPDGSFEFRNVPSGLHRLRLSNSMGQTINEEMVDVSSGRPLSIHFPPISKNLRRNSKIFQNDLKSTPHAPSL